VLSPATKNAAARHRFSFVRRSSRFSRSIPDACGLSRGHPGIELRRRPPLDPLRSDSAPTPRVLAAGEISPASLPVSAAGGRRAARRASSLRRCRSATTGRPRARRRSRSLGWVVMALPPPKARLSKETRRRQRAPLVSRGRRGTPRSKESSSRSPTASRSRPTSGPASFRPPVPG